MSPTITAPRALILTALTLTLTIASAPPAAGQPLIELSDQPIDLAAITAASQQGAAASAIESTSSAALPSDDIWLVPFVVDTEDPGGTTTLLGIRMQDETSGDPAIEVEFLDNQLQLFHELVIELEAKDVQSFNLRDQPGLPNGGIQRGLVRIRPTNGDRIFVDYFVVTPSEDFASGGQAIDFFVEACGEWSTRVLVGGPFTGGTDLQVLIDGPQGADPADEPTLFGNVYDEGGNFINSFTVRTDEFVLELPAADIIQPANLFGVVEIGINATGFAGVVRTEISAEGRYSIGLPAFCTFIPVAV